MEFKDINFDSLESTRKRCITFAKDGNTVVKPYKALYCVEQITHNPEHKTLYVEVLPDNDSDVRLWNDYGKIAYSIGRIQKECTLEKFTEQIKSYGIGVDGFLKRLEYAKEAGHYINLVDIETVFLIGKIELARRYAEYRELKVKENEEKYLKEQKEREVKDKAEEEKRLEEINKQIEDTEYKIFHQEKVKNTDIDGKSVINLLMQKHGIKVPLRTQGWINSKLAMIVFDHGEISYKFFGKSQRDNSTVFKKYLVELEKAINQTFTLPIG